MKKILLMAAFAFASIAASSQADSCRLRISLLTCGPGEDLYSIWGHTGIRLIDSTKQTDVVFNYGTFDDRDPLFYIKFTRGIMLYSVAPYAFQDFMEEYRVEKRSVAEQVLSMNCLQKRLLAKSLWDNAREENKYYPYHFYADNCTTRARDMLISQLDSNTQFKDIRPQPGTSTYRQLIHSYMNSSTQAWNRLAIDVLLGNHLDEAMNNRQAMFLPDYLMKGFDGASWQSRPLISETNLLLPAVPPNHTTFFTPIVSFSVLLLIMLAISFGKSKTAQQTAVMLDSLFFLLTGLLGLLMLALWIFRVDNVCRNNYNLLWALPTHTVIAFFITRKNNWIKYYWLFTIILTTLLLVAWKWLPQDMNNSVLLLMAIILYRSIVRYRKCSRV